MKVPFSELSVLCVSTRDMLFQKENECSRKTVDVTLDITVKFVTVIRDEKHRQNGTQIKDSNKMFRCKGSKRGKNDKQLIKTTMEKS